MTLSTPSFTLLCHNCRHRTTLRDRSQLLGTNEYSTPPSSGRSSPFGGAVSGRENPFQPLGQRYADDLESQNDEHLEGLTAKVKLLKDVRVVSRIPCYPLTWRICISDVDHHWDRERSPRLNYSAQPDGTYNIGLVSCTHSCEMQPLRTMHSLRRQASSLARFAA